MTLSLLLKKGCFDKLPAKAKGGNQEITAVGKIIPLLKISH
jgi:hypothetical protein